MSKKTALVVDDEPDIVKIIKTMLEAEGYEVWCANDGLEVFPLLAEKKPDVLIIDRMMPGMNGMEVISKLKESPKTSSIPVIMLTSMGKLDDVSEGYRGGADGYLTKPFTKTQIINGINLVLSARPTLSPEQLRSHAPAFLKACARLSKRTEELAGRFAAEVGLAPDTWSMKWLEARLRTDQDQLVTLAADPEWRCRFHGWGVSFHNGKTREQADLAIGPGGRCDTFDDWRVQSYIQAEARRGIEFSDLHAIVEKHNDAVSMMLDYLSRQQWIEPAGPKAGTAKTDLDAELGDRWAITAKGWKKLQKG